MPIVIMPNGEMVDSVTGNPVNTPRPMPDNLGEFIANRPMRERTGAALTPQELQSDTLRRTGSAMTDLEKVQMLMDMGLDQDTAIEAVAMEKNMPPVDPREFGGQQAPMQGGTPMPTQQMPQPMMTNPGMGALSGVPTGATMPMPMRRPEDLMMRNNPMGQDRTMNPMDRLTPRNAPST
jgi:hypothetical protein